MRTLALVDVRTGNWFMLTPEQLEGTSWSQAPRRAAVDQQQVEKMKREAYALAVEKLLEAGTSN